jgi:hypothetical protein
MLQAWNEGMESLRTPKKSIRRSIQKRPRQLPWAFFVLPAINLLATYAS